MRKFKKIHVAVAAAAIAAAAIGWSVSRGPLSSAAMEPIQSIVTGEIEDLATLITMARGVERGDPNAPITILEFADFQCPACAEFAAFVKPEIELAYVQEGIARFIFHDYPFVSGHPYAFLAARGARCALDQGEQHFWSFHDQLFSHQPTWSLSRSPPLGAFESYAGAIGLDLEVFAACLNSDRHADVVSANLRLALEMAVDGTPSILVSKDGGRGINVIRWNEFAGVQEVVERLMEGDL